VHAIGYHRAVIDAPRELVETHAVSAKVVLERGQVHRADIADGLDADLLHSLFGDFAHAGNATDW
jgi:hypothetical protein